MYELSYSLPNDSSNLGNKVKFRHFHNGCQKLCKSICQRFWVLSYLPCPVLPFQLLHKVAKLYIVKTVDQLN